MTFSSFSGIACAHGRNSIRYGRARQHFKDYRRTTLGLDSCTFHAEARPFFQERDVLRRLKTWWYDDAATQAASGQVLPEYSIENGPEVAPTGTAFAGFILWGANM
jgi:hypothetical protein